MRAEEYRKFSLRWANWDHYLHYILGIAAAAAAALAGYAGTAEWKTIAGLAGAGAALLVVIQTLTKAEERSQFHYKRLAGFEGVGLKAQALKEQGNPSQAEIERLIDELTEIGGRTFGGAPGP